MADYQFTQHKNDNGDSILVSSTLFNSSDATINAMLPADTAPGTIIHTAGYQSMKEKGLDGTWTSL